jgi:hypothetical protein
VSKGQDFFFYERLAKDSVSVHPISRQTTIYDLFRSMLNLYNSKGLALGVADGVGGWEDTGFDPSMFSQALMYHAAQSARRRTSQEVLGDDVVKDVEEEISDVPIADPSLILEDAYKGVMSEREVIAGVYSTIFFFHDTLSDMNPEGSSTACIVTLNRRNGEMRAAKYVARFFVQTLLPYICSYFKLNTQPRRLVVPYLPFQPNHPRPTCSDSFLQLSSPAR